MKQPTKKITKILLLLAIILVASVVAFFIWLHFSFRPFDTQEVRKWWSETALANSEYYRIAEETNLAKEDTIYLRIKEIPGKLFTYHCGTPFGIRQCHLGDSLDYYFLFDKYGDERLDLLEKHHLNSSGHALKYSQIGDVRGFAQDLLKISDIQRLYKAFLAECDRTSVEQAKKEFDWYFLKDINSKNTTSHTTGLFEWMREQGL